MADHSKFPHGIERLPTTSKILNSDPEGPPSYTEASQHAQHIQEGPGDLPPDLHQGPKVLEYKLEEPQVPATSSKMKK